MSVADWRALLEALLDGRVSPQAFARRFLEALAAARRTGEPVPAPIRAMVAAVEAFDADNDVDDDAPNSDELEQSARRALADLHDPAASSPRTFDRARAREDMQRFTMRVSGCGGVGCLIAIAWVALWLLQIQFVSEWVQHAFEMSALPSTVLGFVLALIPIVGNALAFLDATEIRHWHPAIAAIVFFAAPVATMVSGWMRWRRYR